MQLDQNNKQYSSKCIASAALQFFFNVSKQLDLTEIQECILLGNPSIINFNKWKNNLSADKLNDDTLDRISYLMGVHKALTILLQSKKAATERLKKPNSAAIFSGESALNKMLKGKTADIADVRRFLDYQCNI